MMKKRKKDDDELVILLVVFVLFSAIAGGFTVNSVILTGGSLVAISSANYNGSVSVESYSGLVNSSGYVVQIGFD